MRGAINGEGRLNRGKISIEKIRKEWRGWRSLM